MLAVTMLLLLCVCSFRGGGERIGFTFRNSAAAPAATVAAAVACAVVVL